MSPGSFNLLKKAVESAGIRAFTAVSTCSGDKPN